jgi:hypothetical protein
MFLMNKERGRKASSEQHNFRPLLSSERQKYFSIKKKQRERGGEKK